MCEETNDMNQSRKLCFMYFDHHFSGFLPPNQHPTSFGSIQTMRAEALNNPCRVIHNPSCAADWALWMEDHPIDERNMQEVYAQQTESEEDARERLDDPTASSSFSGTSYIPASSQ